MSATRQRILGVLLLFLLAVAGLLLLQVLGTVFLAITVAYVLVPVHRWLVARGASSWWASFALTVFTFVAALLVLAPLFLLVYVRRVELLAVISDLPDSVTATAFDYQYTLDASTVLAYVTDYLSSLAPTVAAALPVLAVKFTLFAIVVFALLIRRRELRDALLAPIPPTYHDVAEAFHERTRATLAALYVLQAATALGTVVVAYPLFWVFGYEFAASMAVIAALLQFFPIVGPSIMIAGIVAYELSVGATAKAAAIGVLGVALVGWLPDVLIRPRLARETAGLPGSLYFIGFVGGLLSVGPVGIIAGPLAVALLAEGLELLAAERD